MERTDLSLSAEVIRLAYEGVDRPLAWGQMLEEAGRLFRAKDVYYVRIPRSADEPKFVQTWGVDPKIEKLYRSVWAFPPRNPTLRRCLDRRTDGVIVSRCLLPKSEFEQTEFFQLVRRPRGVDDELSSSDLFGGDGYFYLTLNRAVGDSRFGRGEIRTMGLLRPHLIQALKLQASLTRWQQRAALCRTALDQQDDAVIRRAPDGRLHPVNGAGEELMESERLNGPSGASLPRDPRSGRQDKEETSPAGKIAVVVRLQSGRLYSLFTSPCFSGGTFLGEVLRLRPLDRTEPRLPYLDDRGFTPQERRVASLLCQGLKSAEICSEIGIGPETLHTHIQHLFDKTGCRSRVQLVTLLSRPPEPERPHEAPDA
jgi:DNA-binding CsgD family transcriptional regulator